MKLIRSLNFWGTACILSLLFFATSCIKCVPCQYPVGWWLWGDCKPDTIKYHCPPGIRGAYDYHDCTCLDYYFRFRYGYDTLSLSAMITTSDFIQTLPYGSAYDCYFTGGDIDTIKIRGMLITTEPGSFSICDTGYPCINLEVIFDSSGTVAHSISGITVDTFSGFFSPVIYQEGTFRANLQISGTGQNFYMREGAFRLPIDIP